MTDVRVSREPEISDFQCSLRIQQQILRSKRESRCAKSSSPSNKKTITEIVGVPRGCMTQPSSISPGKSAETMNKFGRINLAILTIVRQLSVRTSDLDEKLEEREKENNRWHDDVTHFDSDGRNPVHWVIDRSTLSLEYLAMVGDAVTNTDRDRYSCIPKWDRFHCHVEWYHTDAQYSDVSSPREDWFPGRRHTEGHNVHYRVTCT